MNPDQQHLKEYNDYLEKLTIQELTNLTPEENQWRLARIDSVKNCIKIVEKRLKSDKK